jgi:drug/metabolite transporter (DMT)-like permease
MRPKAGAPQASPAGVVACVVSALAFSGMTIFAKLAYRANVNVVTLLGLRYAIAAMVLGTICAVARRTSIVSNLGAREIGAAVLLGGALVAIQSAIFFTALTKLDASLAVLLLYTYPALVTLGALTLGRDQPNSRRIGGLLAASLGLVLVLAQASSGSFTSAGVTLALLAAAAYAVYLLLAEQLLRRADPIGLTTVICAAAAVSFLAFGLASGELHRPTETGLLWIGSIGLVSTAISISALYLGVRLIGAASASTISTLEPVAGVLLACLIFGDQLGAIQWFGAALVVGSVLWLVSAPEPKPGPGASAAMAEASRPAG